MNLTIGNTTTVTSLTGLRLNVITLAGPQGPPGIAGTGGGSTGSAFNGDLTIPYNTVTNAVSLFNTTKAVATGNAFSPFIKQEGFSWNSASAGNSVPLEFRYGVKTENQFNGGGSWVIESSLNSGAWITGLEINNNGTVIVDNLSANTASVGILYGDNLIASNNVLFFSEQTHLGRTQFDAVLGDTDSRITFDPTSGFRTLTILDNATISGTGVPTSRTINSIPLTGDITLTATNIPVAVAPGAGFSNLQQFINTMHSPGLINGAIISDAGGGIMRISPGTGMLRVADDDVSSLLFVSMTGTSISVPQDLTQYYVGFVYNSGAPMYQMRSVNNWDNDTEIPLGTIVNFFGLLIPSNNPFRVGDPITNIIQRFDAMAPITRDQMVGGLNLGEAGTRNVLLSAGKLWTRLNDYSVPAISTAVTPTMYSAYYNGLYWVYTTMLGQWDNANYNDITAGLVPLSIGYYSNLWFYLTVESNSFGFIYDQHQYGDLTSASLASPPSFLPLNFTNGSILLGRFIFHGGAATADQIDSAFVTTFSSSPITSHNQLAGLQGGNASEYYHLNQSDYSVLTGRAGSTIVNSVNGVSGATLITGAQGITVSRSGQLITVSGQDWATNANLTATGITLGARDALVSGNATSGIAASGSSLYGLITAFSGQANVNYATVSNLALTGSGLYGQVTGSSGVLSVNLTNTGAALGARDTLISGIAVTGTAQTGAALYSLITNASGAANLAYATIANLGLTGQQAYQLYTGLSGALGVTGSTLDTKINSLSGFTTGVSGALQAIINAGGGATVAQLNSLSGWSASALNLALTGSNLYRLTTGMSGALVALIGASAAGVSSLNGASGVLNLNGAANVTVTTAGQTITVSGNTGDYALFALKTDLGTTGTTLLARDLLTSGILSSGLAVTGSSLYTIITGLSGQAVSTYATITNLTQSGVQLGNSLALTGSNLFATVTGMSGAFNVALATTGAALLAANALTSGIATTGITTSGAALYSIIVGLSGQAISSYATIINLASTGSSLYALVTGLSGQAVGAYATIPNLALTGSGLSTTITATGAGLYGLIVGMSGQDVINYATKASLTASGTLLSAIQITGSSIIPVANFTGLGGTLVIYSGNTIFVSGAAGSAGGGSNVQVTGSAVLATVNLTGINGLAVIYSGNQVFISGNGNTIAQVTGSVPINTVNLTGFGTTVITYDGTLIRISGAPAGTGAGVTSLNGVTSAVTLIGTGGLQVTNVGGNVYISGLTTTTGKQIVFMNQAGVLSGDSSLLWDETNDVLAVVKTRLHTSGISIAAGDKITLGTGVIVSESGLTFQSNSLAGGGTLGVTGLAGYAVASIIQSGLQRSQGLIGPALWSKQYTAVVPQTTTAVTVYGNTSATVGTLSTVSTEVLGQYTNFATAAATFVVAGSAVTTPYYFRGTMTGRNGFFFTSTFSFADGNSITGAYGQPSGSRFFIGMTDQSATASVITNDPAGNRVGLSYVVATGGTQADRYNTDWIISAKNNVTEFTGSIGMNFQTGFYRFSMYAPPFAANNTGVYWQLDDLIRGSGAAGIITGNLPIGSTQMRPNAMICTISGGAHNLRVNNLYVENAGAT